MAAAVSLLSSVSVSSLAVEAVSERYSVSPEDSSAAAGNAGGT